jgi:hypothetical protein
LREVVEANAVSIMEKQSTVSIKTNEKSKPVEAKRVPHSTARTVNLAKANATLNKHTFPVVALSKNKKKTTKATTKKAVRPRCTESQRHILAEGAVDIAEILLGAGLYEMIPMKNRVRLAVKKAESIRKIVDREKYDRLLRDLPTKTLPTITPAALLKWLDGEFRDVIDAVFFVDSPEEFAKLLETFAQGIAANFFGDQVKVRVKVNHTPQQKALPATSNEVMPAIEPDPAKMAPPASDLPGVSSGV